LGSTDRQTEQAGKKENGFINVKSKKANAKNNDTPLAIIMIIIAV
jgi:hypothetical protein